jgi:hypothetical protein
LPDAERALLRQHIQVLLAEKNFEGCGGLTLTDRERIVIAAHACLLILHRDNDYYAGLYSVLVYPEAFAPKRYDPDTLDFEGDSDDLHEGESWGVGTVILSWDDVAVDAEYFDGRNVVLHEFAHQLYDNEEKVLDDAAASARWIEVFEKHYAAHVSAVGSRPAHLSRRLRRGRRRGVLLRRHGGLFRAPAEVPQPATRSSTANFASTTARIPPVTSSKRPDGVRRTQIHRLRARLGPRAARQCTAPCE